MTPKYSLLFFSLVCVITFSFNCVYSASIEKYSLLMPDVHPYVEELYLCTPVRVNYTKNYYIVGFEPSASMDTAHHMLLYGCATPGSSRPVWNCGEMSKSEHQEDFSSPCKNGSQVIYAWARDAPKLTLPEGVGFKVGGDSPIQYLVLQVHYAHIMKFKDGATDNSGIHLYYTEEPMVKLAGVLLLGTAGFIPPHKIEHMETSCQIYENKILHPFAFRTHTHSLGKVVSGYRVQKNNNGIDQWTLIGKKDPLLPEMFYPVENNTITIRPGDLVAARCTMDSSEREDITYIGPTNQDEMCNFYLMYWVEGTLPLKTKYCFSPGPPGYYWDKDGGLNNIANDASVLN